MNDLIKLIKTRRSIRSFSDKPISDEYLAEIVETAVYAPSARNSQKWLFTVVTKREDIQKLAKAVGRCLDRGDEYDFYDPTSIIITTYERDYRFGPVDCACAIENMFLAAHSLGIGSVWINQLIDSCDDPEVRTILDSFGIPADHVAGGMVALGYANSEPRQIEKKLELINWTK